MWFVQMQRNERLVGHPLPDVPWRVITGFTPDGQLCVVERIVVEYLDELSDGRRLVDFIILFLFVNLVHVIGIVIDRDVVIGIVIVLGRVDVDSVVDIIVVPETPAIPTKAPRQGIWSVLRLLVESYSVGMYTGASG